MMNQETRYSTFIITGMHRSGTSLTSSLIESTGVNVGIRLMGASVGNSKGHFENLDFVELHERILISQGISREGWTLQKEISVPQQLCDEARRIIEKNSISHFWGWKDPRTSLFLDFWSDLLPQAYFVFTYRSPWEVVDSLYRRGDETFYSNPKYALEIWIHYNMMILDFYNRFPNKCILLNVDALIADCNLISRLCQDKFGLELKEPNDNIIDKSLMSALSSSSYRPLLIAKFFPQAIEVFNNLNSQADFKYQSFVFEDVEMEKFYRDWIFQDWLDICKISRNHKIEFEKLQQTQAELERSQSQFQHTQSELERSQSQLQQTQSELERSQNTVLAMETSKFWKLRRDWFKIKQKIGFTS